MRASKFPKHESHETYIRHRKNHIHEIKHEHLYKEGAKGKEERAFEKRYGKKKGRYVYGSVVGKVKREREGK